MSTLTMVYLLYYICYYLLNIIKVFSVLLFRQTKLRDALDIDYSQRDGRTSMGQHRIDIDNLHLTQY